MITDPIPHFSNHQAATAQLLMMAKEGGMVRSLDLSGADLRNVNVCGLRADQLDLSSSRLQCAQLQSVRLLNCTLAGANLAQSDFSSATLRLCGFDNAHAEASNFDSSTLEDSSAVAADFSGATFQGAHLTETSFSRAVLRNAIFDGAEGDGVEFRGADLQSASLKGVRFDEADFRGADLSHADLSQGRFHSADFRGAILDGANFDGADYSGATFDRGAETEPAAALPGKAPQTESDPAVFPVLDSFLSLLPAALSGLQPAETLLRTQQAIDQAASAAGYSEEQKNLVRDCISKITTTGSVDAAHLKQLLSALESDSPEPPDALKPWLEPLFKPTRKEDEP